MSPDEIVRQFCELVSKRDGEVLRPLLADDVVYHNIGLPASRGVDAALANLAGQWEMFPASYDFEIRSLAVNGETVLTERIDRVGPPGVTAPVPLMGVFEVRDGKIQAWRDYCDYSLVAKLMGGEDTSELIS
jgi:limonene-1,2-epoxide hydrolase